jgi:phenylacetate-CoA ligase
MKATQRNTVLSVIAPCLNEEANIPALVERVLATFLKMNVPGEFVLVDDGSSDNTCQLIEEAIQMFPQEVTGIFHTQNKGIEQSWLTGLNAAHGRLVCLIDADLQYLPEDISRLYHEYERRGVDVVQGWRTSINRERNIRYFLSIGLNVLLNTCFGMRAKDNKSGFILTRRDILADILHHRFLYSYFQTFITVAACAKGYSIAEIEVLSDRRRAGRSFLITFPLTVVIGTFADIAKGMLEYRFGKQHDTFLSRFLHQHSVEDRSPAWKKIRRMYFKIYLACMPLHSWLITRRVGDYFQLLRKSQWLSSAEIKELQLVRLRALLEHSYRHVPYWRETFDALGLTPSDIQSIDDLARLPLLEKQTVRERVHFDMMSDNHRKNDILRVSTSGSTGQPLICYADRAQLELRWASTLRSQEWTGYRFGDRCVRLWHQTIGMTRLQVLRERIDALLTRRTFIPAYQINEHNVRQFLATIERVHPTLIDGYAESFNFLSTYLKSAPATTARPCGIMSSGQTLSPQSRAMIEKSFCTKVYDKYGSREFSGIAYECEDGEGHHVVAESYIVEILKNGRPALPGEVGEVVITDLNNYVMPFIRYRIGDLARVVEGECSCGRGLPLIGSIEGRTQSIIVGVQKQYIPGTFFAHFFKEYDHALYQYQVEQRERGSIILRLVRTKRFNEAVLDEILCELQKYLGPNMRIEVEYPEIIALSRTGKVQVSVSQLDLDFQTLAHQV